MPLRSLRKIDPDTMVWVSLGVHLGWAHALYLTPHLFEQLPIYRMFSRIMLTEHWSLTCLGMGLLLLVGLRWRSLLPAAHFLSFLLLTLMALVFYAPNGFTTASNTYGWIGLLSALSYSKELARLLRSLKDRVCDRD